MSLDLRDELAARIVATLDSHGEPSHGDLGPERLARRAYDLAEALLRERARRDEGVDEQLDELRRWDDPLLDAPPHDPSWEVEPRWSHDDRAALEARLARLGPGLAAVRPQDEADERTGT